MLLIHYPEPSFHIREEAGKELIFDSLRKKWLTLTPEEWVRQNFIAYLTREMKYPATLIAVEKELRLGELKKRFDILVYDRAHQPWLMVECKSMEVQLDQAVLEQVLRYNISIPVPYIVICNGQQCFGWERKNNRLEEIGELPVLPQ